MFMKKFYALLLAMAAGSAFAVDGTVTINGNVASATCTVTGPTTITLPTVSKTSLASTGAVAGTTVFSITTNPCTAATINTYFEPNSFNANNRLTNSGTATNVEVRLLNSSGTALTPTAGPGAQGVTATSVVGSTATQSFYAQYYATGAATAGTVIATFQYTMIYT